MAIADKEYVLNKLSELTTYAKKNLGQNFLIDNNVSLKIVEALEIKDNQTIIEIGPGLGALTFNLAAYSSSLIKAYDIDEVMINHLNKTFKMDNNVEIIYSDFLKVDLNDLYKNKDVSFIGNLPYYITTPILEKILTSNIHIDNCVFMVQKEVYSRLNAKVGTKEYSPLSILIEFVGKLTKVMDVSFNKFYPAPHVDSLVFKIDCYKDYNHTLTKEFYNFLNKCFFMRRKTILNNLNGITNNKNISNEILKQSNIDSLRRPETITLNEYVTLFNNINYFLGKR